MDNKFVIRSQHNLYLAKNKEDWITGEERNQVLALKHHDEALNTLIEKNSKDIQLRGSIVEVPLDEKAKPIVEVLAAPEELEQQDLLAKGAADQAAETTDFVEVGEEEQGLEESSENDETIESSLFTEDAEAGSSDEISAPDSEDSEDSDETSVVLGDVADQSEEAAAPEDEAETVG